MRATFPQFVVKLKLSPQSGKTFNDNSTKREPLSAHARHLPQFVVKLKLSPPSGKTIAFNLIALKIIRITQTKMDKFNGHKNSQITVLSRNLRNNMTKEERHLWFDFLQNLPVRINRQKVFHNYIVDFYCARYNIVIEVDGTQHYLTEGAGKDEVRDAYFSDRGIKVLRYSNADINKNFRGVCEDILDNMKGIKDI